MNKVNPEDIRPDIIERIKLVWGTHDRASFARVLNVSPSYITMIEKGKRLPSVQLTELIALKFEVNLRWLIYGEGPMKVEKGEAPMAPPPSGGPAYSPDTQRYVDKLVAILTGPDQKMAGKLEERIDIIYGEMQAEKDRVKRGA